MPDKEKEQETKTAGEGKTSKPAETKTGILTWIIIISIILVLSSSGFVVGRLVAGSEPTEESAAVEEEAKGEQTDPKDPKKQTAKPGTWYFDKLDPVVVNPDEPGATRFVRVGLILEIDNQWEQTEAVAAIESKKPLLINWLNLYFKSLSLDQMADERDMNRILTQIKDGFNDILFPESKPQIQNILIREFNIQ